VRVAEAGSSGSAQAWRPAAGPGSARGLARRAALNQWAGLPHPAMALRAERLASKLAQQVLPVGSATPRLRADRTALAARWHRPQTAMREDW
jgi:hypothetical protein